MGRPSKLTEKQWQDVERRHLAGESIGSLAKEFGVAKNAIFVRVSSRTKTKKSIADQVAKAEMALTSLSPIDQVSVRQLADELKAISRHLVSGAQYGAMTFDRLSRMAHTKTEFIDETQAIDASTPELRSVAALTAVANEAAKTGLNLLAANKDMLKDPHDTEANTLKVIVQNGTGAYRRG